MIRGRTALVATFRTCVGFAAFPGVRHFFWQPCYAFPIGMGVEARLLPAANNKVAVQRVSGVRGSLTGPQTLIPCRW